MESGSFMNENHDYEVYSKYYGDNLLNADSKVMKVKDVVPHSSFFNLDQQKIQKRLQEGF